MVREEAAVRGQHTVLRTVRARANAAEDSGVRGGREDVVRVVRADCRERLVLGILVVGCVGGGGVDLDLQLALLAHEEDARPFAVEDGVGRNVHSRKKSQIIC